KIVTDVRELGHVVDHDIMKRDQESARFFQPLLEEDKTTDKFKNEMTPSQNCRQFTTSEPSCSKNYRQLTSTEKITDRFKNCDPALNVFMVAKHELRPKANWPTIDAPVKLPKTTHTQISLLQCHSTKHLELGPLHKGNIKYLGHTVSKEGLIPNPKKVDGIRSYSTPKTPTELRRFLRMVSYYCRFVPFFSKVAHLLRIFIEKNQSFSWTEEC
ncbi:MAG: hypothetical protein GY820_09695, partial [Gammaproteobacteria bacterium]|nr:hypothetical protein [Gammaproteobacteria bacterium]